MIMYYDNIIFFYKKLKKYNYISPITQNYYTGSILKNYSKISWYPQHFLINLPKNTLSSVNIFFLRTQKRYNKMRYTRTKRYSRVAFYVSLLALILVGQRLE